MVVQLGDKQLYSQEGRGGLDNWEHSYRPSKNKKKKRTRIILILTEKLLHIILKVNTWILYKLLIPFLSVNGTPLGRK